MLQQALPSSNKADGGFFRGATAGSVLASSSRRSSSSCARFPEACSVEQQILNAYSCGGPLVHAGDDCNQPRLWSAKQIPRAYRLPDQAFARSDWVSESLACNLLLAFHNLQLADANARQAGVSRLYLAHQRGLQIQWTSEATNNSPSNLQHSFTVAFQ